MLGLIRVDRRFERLRLDRRLGRQACAGVILLLFMAWESLAAEGVVLKSGLKVAGQIERYDDRGLWLKLDSGHSSFYPKSEVERIDAPMPLEYIEGKSALEKRSLGEAVELLTRSLTNEKRSWVQGLIKASLLDACHRLGRWEDAGKLYLEMYSERTDFEVLAFAPLCWSSEEKGDDSTVAIARQWLTREEPMARLLAASWLLNRVPGEVIGPLDDLQTIDQRVGVLARAQRWRMEEKVIDAGEWNRRRSLLAKMPRPMRAGPQFALARAFERSGKLEDAAIGYLWVGYIYSPGTDTGAESLLRAAQCSEAIGLPKDAQILYREVVENYPGTLWATEAAGGISRAGLKD